ncbi:MAG: hypothetical protein Q9Q40_06655 [Acidobacteriota bacterium]|nr:hypothetical protein [Acidobacteriota bacterium]MDQ7088318.1 hypothetical protein [Acidobacteriota bacterium]
MRSKGVLAAVIVLALLVVFVARERRRDVEEGVLKPSEVIFPWGTYRVTDYEFELRSEPGGKVHFRRGSEGWEVASGTPGADVTFAPDLLSAWSRIRFVESVDEHPTGDDLERYGLAEPIVSLVAQLSAPEGGEGEGAREARLEVGLPSPLKPAFYARIDGFPRVVLISADAADLVQGSGREALGLPSLISEPRR